MEVPPILTQLEPLSECGQLVSTWFDTNFWVVTMLFVCAVIGLCATGFFLMLTASPLVDLAINRWWRPSQQKDKG